MLSVEMAINGRREYPGLPFNRIFLNIHKGDNIDLKIGPLTIHRVAGRVFNESGIAARAAKKLVASALDVGVILLPYTYKDEINY